MSDPSSLVSPTSPPETKEDTPENALQENIDKKGKNSYYFAHANEAKGPEWDGKPQPRLISKGNSSIGLEQDAEKLQIAESDEPSNADASAKSPLTAENKQSSFDFKNSNITKYSFLDEDKKVKIYIDLNGVGTACTNEDDVTLEWTERTLKLEVKNYPGEESESPEDGEKECPIRRLCFARLNGPIVKGVFRKKQDKIIVTLTKKEREDGTVKYWHQVNAILVVGQCRSEI